MNAARLFPTAGLNLWKKPIKNMYPELTEEEMEAVPEESRMGGSWSGGAYKVPGWPEKKPLVSSWTSQPRMYPPGDLLIFAPFAAIYQHTGITTKTLNRLLVVMCLLFAHLAIYIVAMEYFKDQASGPGIIGALALFFFYSISVRYSLEGFYDMAAVVPLLLCGIYLSRRQGLAAIVAYCLAAFIHFRAYFFAPLALYGAWMVVADGQWRSWKAKQYLGVFLAALFGGLSLYTFYLVAPTFKEMEINNLVNLWKVPFEKQSVFAFAIIMYLAAFAFVWARSWMDLAILGWLWVMVSTLRQAYDWHLMIPLAWLGLPLFGSSGKRAPFVRDLRLVVLLSVATFVFDCQMGPKWLEMVFR